MMDKKVIATYYEIVFLLTEKERFIILSGENRLFGDSADLRLVGFDWAGLWKGSK